MIKKARIDLQGNITVQKFLSRHELNMVKKRNMQYCAAQLRQDIAQIKKYLAKKSKIASSATYYAAHKEEYAAYRAAHKEEISKTKAAYYAAHKETPEYKLAHGQKQCANCSAWARLRKAYVNGQSVFLCNACIGLG